MKHAEKIRDLALLFLTFAFAGWVYEVALGFLHHGRFLNRGYCFGPWLPIYGVGGLVLYALFARLFRRPLRLGRVNVRPVTVVLYIALFATAIELASTYVMQLFGVPFSRLWDYTHYAFHFQGRVALVPSLRFGLLGAGLYYAVLPLYERFVAMKNRRVYHIVSCVLLGLFLLDLLCRIPFGNHYTGPA